MAQIKQPDLKQYLSYALECVEFKLVRHRDEIDTAKSFRPEFAHQIFDENECIFGYKDLRICLFYTAGPLNIYLDIKYSSKVEELGISGMKSDDIMTSISKLLTFGCFYTNIDEFVAKLDKEESFQPFGDKVHSWTIEKENSSRTYETYECNVSTPGFKAFHSRLQTFLLWFVDAASYIDIEDSQWTFFVCYEKFASSDGKAMYATVGYTTIYLYYAYPQNIRPRISQMLVLPPFQGQGIGAQLIETVYNKYRNDPKVIDITVEDPSDDFRRVRNFVDIKLCRELPAFAKEKLPKGFTKEMAAAAKDTHKINPRQSRIVYEILRLGATNVNDEQEYRGYRLDVKKRLNGPHQKQKNDIKRMEKAGVDVQRTLASLPTTDVRIEQLKEEYKAHEEEYFRILQRLKQH